MGHPWPKTPAPPDPRAFSAQRPGAGDAALRLAAGEAARYEDKRGGRTVIRPVVVIRQLEAPGFIDFNALNHYTAWFDYSDHEKSWPAGRYAWNVSVFPTLEITFSSFISENFNLDAKFSMVDKDGLPLASAQWIYSGSSIIAPTASAALKLDSEVYDNIELGTFNGLRWDYTVSPASYVRGTVTIFKDEPVGTIWQV